MAADEDEGSGWGDAILGAIDSAAEEDDEVNLDVVSGSGLDGEAAGHEGELPYVILLKQAVAAVKGGQISDEEFVEGVSKLDVIADNALKVYAIPAVKKDLPGKLSEHQNDIVNSLEVEIHRLKEGLGLLLDYPETRSLEDLDTGLKLAVAALNAAAIIQKKADAEKNAIDQRKKEDKARRAQAANQADTED